MASRRCQTQFYEEPRSWDPRVFACMIVLSCHSSTYAIFQNILLIIINYRSTGTDMCLLLGVCTIFILLYAQYISMSVCTPQDKMYTKRAFQLTRCCLAVNQNKENSSIVLCIILFQLLFLSVLKTSLKPKSCCYLLSAYLHPFSWCTRALMTYS